MSTKVKVAVRVRPINKRGVCQCGRDCEGCVCVIVSMCVGGCCPHISIVFFGILFLMVDRGCEHTHPTIDYRCCR